MISVQELQAHVTYLKTCCLHIDFDESRISNVLFAHDSSSDDGSPIAGDRDGFWVFSTVDGHFGVVSDSEDYTGHG